MSSRGGGKGGRAAGSDGSDHEYRQKVDSKYAKAAAARKSLKKMLGGRGLHSFTFPLNLSSLCPCPLNLSLHCPPYTTD
jgi:hypothetical protein